MVNENKEKEIQAALENFGHFVNSARKGLGMTFEELGERTNLSPSYIYRLSKNARKSTLNTQVNILSNGLSWSKEEIMEFLELVIADREALKGIVD